MFNKVKVNFFAEMPIDGLVVYGHYNGSRGSNTPGFSNGLGNGSTPVPGFSNETVHAGTDLDGSGGQEWIQITILILFVVFLPPILFGSVRWVSNFIFCTE